MLYAADHTRVAKRRRWAARAATIAPFLAAFVAGAAFASERSAFEAKLRGAARAGATDSVAVLIRAERGRVPEAIETILVDRMEALVAGRRDSADVLLGWARAIATGFRSVYGDTLCENLVRVHEPVSLETLPRTLGAWRSVGAVRALDETSQWAAAVEQAPEMLRQADATSDPYLRLRARRLAARCVFMTGAFSEARDAFQTAASLAHEIGDRNAEARLLGNVALTLQAQDRPREAAEFLEKASALARPLGDLNYLAWTLNALGSNRLLAGDPEGARVRLEEARRVAHEGRFVALESEVMGNLANVLGDLGRYEEALALEEEALRLAHDTGTENKRNELNAMFLMSWLSSELGYHARSLALLEEALPLAMQAGTADQAGLIRSQLGEAYLSLGEPEAALRLYREGLPIWRETGIHRFEVMDLLRISSVYTACGKPDSAFDAAKRALVEAERFHVAETYALSEAAGFYLDRGDAVAAEPLLHRALAIAEERDNPLLAGTAEAGLARALALRGRDAQALDHFDRAITLGRSAPYHTFLREALRAKAAFLRRGGRLAEADSLLAEVITLVEATRVRQPREGLRVGYFTTQRAAYGERVEVLYERSLSAPSPEPFLREAFDTSERAHGRALLDVLASTSPAGPSADSTLSAKEQALRARVRSLEAELAAMTTSDEWDAARVDTLTKQITEAAAEHVRVLDRLVEVDPSRAALTQGLTLSIADIQGRVLEPDQVLLEYLVGPASTTLFVVSRSALDVHRLPISADSLSARIDRFRERLRTEHEPDPGTLLLARALHETLVGPAGDRLEPNTRLVVVPDGPLYHLPFCALHDGRRFLVEDHAISTSPSASVLDARLARRGPSRARGLLAVANPTALAAASVVPAHPGERARFGELPYSEEETRLIAARFRHAVRLVGSEARERAVKQAIGGARYVHFATHAFVDDREPSGSGLVLAEETGREEDGMLRTSEVAGLRLSADLVTLSACSTGLGRMASGEGILGLARSFLGAGARGILVSLWEVQDRSTATLMQDVYEQHLGKRSTVDAALRTAQTTALAAGRSPREWAPFVLVGSVAAPAPGEGRATILAWVALAVAALGAAWLARVRGKRGRPFSNKLR